ncbi:MAG TPA: nitroreductase [Polyangiaceae bacterium]|nr:nitroreductase [Polyangiaceae bacterium]
MEITHKPADARHDIHPLLRDRWSPRSFTGEPLDEETVRTLLEAARWSASCFNEQPWRYLVAPRSDEAAFEAMLGCLAGANQTWAKNASVLMIACARTTFTRNDKPNRHAWHDVGLANAQLTVQATAMGLGVHQMAGFSSDEARRVYGIPDGFEPVAAIAVGKLAPAEALPDDLRERELAPRSRKPMSEIAFMGTWDQAY